MLLRTLSCLLASGSLLAADTAMNIHHKDGQVVILSRDREILRYQAEPGPLPEPSIDPLYRRGGYLRSLFSPSGKNVLDDFPPNHLHHHGVWTPWTKTSFENRQPDFWNMGQGTGRVDFVAVDRVWAKDRQAGFTARHRFVDMTAKPEKTALLETWEVTVHNLPDATVMDLLLTQTCATPSPLKLPEHHYGGFGVRGHRSWDGAPNLQWLTSSGLTDRNRVNTSREPWCWIGGTIDGKPVGLTIMSHPSNFRHPQPIRAHPTEPFFCFAPQQAGPMEIAPDQPYRARYRIVVRDQAASLEQSRKDFEAWRKQP